MCLRFKLSGITKASKLKKKNQAERGSTCLSTVLATQESEAEGSFETRSLGSAWAIHRDPDVKKNIFKVYKVKKLQ